VRVPIDGSDLAVFPLCLGGNVFGWTADEHESFAVLDAYVEAGGNFLDTADLYAAFAPGKRGGESEETIGRWLRARGARDQIVIATKVGRAPGLKGLAPATIRAAIEGSLRRLQTDYIDLYYAHDDDPQTPLVETLRTFDELVAEGRVRHIAASNYSAPRLREALAVAEREGLARYVALQPHYNLMEREEFEGELAEACEEHGLACLPYWSLARGFLTGKYRDGSPPGASPRAEEASAYLDARGRRVLTALDDIAAERGTSVAAVALAWLLGQSTVAAAVASARTAEQLAGLLPAVGLGLEPGELAALTAASSFNKRGRAG
jgi:aryl-alcohol dehydrogenase-like predicted oxidoreductase